MMRSFLMGFGAFVAATLLNPAATLGATIVSTEAVFDWSGFSYAITGDVEVDVVSYFSRSAARTAAGRSVRGGFDIVDTTAASSSNTGSGSASAAASTTNGLARSDSTATVLGNEPSSDQAAISEADTALTMFVEGVGTMTIAVPYSLAIRVTTDLGPEFGQSVAAFAGASLILGRSHSFQTLRWPWLRPVTNGLLTQTGILTLTIPINSSTSSLVSAAGGAASSARVRATVPDLSAPLLLEMGLIAMFFGAFGRLAGGVR
jgi:hypothetical protein